MVDTLFEILRDIVSPQLYRANAFRVSGLSVAAEDAELYSQLKKLEMLAKLGRTTEQGPTGVLPFQPLPDSDAIRDAGRRLYDRQLRLVDEFFWFWPRDGTGGEEGDAGLESLRRGDIKGAHRHWSAIAGDHPDGFKAVHNLAVLNHAMALDIEHTAENQTDQLGAGIPALREKYWQMALKYWRSTIADEAVWRHMASRAEALADPRLTTGFIHRLRKSLPEVVVSISVDLAVRAAKRDDARHAKRHMAYLGESDFDPALIDRRRDHEAKDFVDRIQRICQAAVARCPAAPPEAYRLAPAVMKDSKTLLIVMKAILPIEHPLWHSACEQVAKTVEHCLTICHDMVVQYAKDTPTTASQLAREVLEECKGLLNDIGAALGDKCTLHRRASLVLAEAVTQCLLAYRDAVVEKSKRSPRTADQLARDILGEHECLVASIDTAFGEEHPLRQVVSVLVARVLRECIIAYYNQTEDWQTGIAVLQQASGLAYEEGLRSRIMMDIALIRGNHPAKPPPRGSWSDRTSDAHRPVRPRVPSTSSSMRLLAYLVRLALVIGAIGLVGWLVNPFSSPRSRRPATSTPSYSNLSARIDSGKARVRTLEVETGRMDAELERLSMSIDRHKQGIEAFERLIRSGRRPDESAYQSTVESHNHLVAQHNSLLTDRNAKYDEYQQEIKSVNDMVARYNRGER